MDSVSSESLLLGSQMAKVSFCPYMVREARELTGSFIWILIPLGGK